MDKWMSSFKNRFKTLLLVVPFFILLLLPQASYGAIFDLYSTGQGLTAGAGQVDTHWAITASPSGASSAFAVTVASPSWFTPASIPISGNWIGPLLNANGGNGYLSNPIGNYTYQTTFSTTGLNNLIKFGYSSDNKIVSARLDGNPISAPSTNTSYGSLLTSSFMVATAGSHTLTFIVNNLNEHNNQPPNAGNPTGLVVDFGNNVILHSPEPSTYLILGSTLGLIGLAQFLRRKKATNC